MHYVGKFEDSRLAAVPLFAGHSQGYTQTSLVDHTRGSVHTGLSVNQLGPGGSLDPHVHSYEESFYILEGRAAVTLAGQTQALRVGDYGVAKVGTVHSWRNDGATPVRWLQMAAPQPRPEGGAQDTFFLADRHLMPGDGQALLGHFDVGEIPPPKERKDVAPGLEGIFLKWMIDAGFGARHHRMAFIEYQPGVGIGLHDHAFEESYFFLSGEVEAVMDGERYDIKAGNVVWTGVGCVHSFLNKGKAPVRWLETFSPQPPAENAFRFAAEWEKKAKELQG